ncbi:hypothetical protein BU16DRAFT_62015 [Lophium mytilinum]|uniref:Uncharacterized protein n=1 Tax=Lophium mytilinum TaxID=390894 RepID=A0A6A6QQK6_9PEZI|nr:hypothetical protein BU16DRAFT_62015 [Lophium mytilinum]
MKNTNEILASFKRVLLCCTCQGHEKPSLQISSPTDVRRVDICMPGLTAEHQAFIRSKAAADATRMFGTDASTPLTSTSTTTLTFRDNPETHTSPQAHSHTQVPRIKSWKNHARKLSASLPYGYKSVHSTSDGADGSMVALRERKSEGGFEQQGVVGGGMLQESDGSGSDGEGVGLGIEKGEEVSLVVPIKG